MPSLSVPEFTPLVGTRLRSLYIMQRQDYLQSASNWAQGGHFQNANNLLNLRDIKLLWSSPQEQYQTKSLLQLSKFSRTTLSSHHDFSIPQELLQRCHLNCWQMEPVNKHLNIPSMKRIDAVNFRRILSHVPGSIWFASVSKLVLINRSHSWQCCRYQNSWHNELKYIICHEFCYLYNVAITCEHWLST